MAFHFKLEKVLHFIRMREAMKQMEVASVLGRVGYLERRGEALETGLRELLAKSHQTISPAWAAFQNAKIAADAKDLSRLEKLLTEERRLLEKRRAELARILMRKKALESLRDKRYAEHRLDENRKRQKALDEAHQLRRVAEKE